MKDKKAKMHQTKYTNMTKTDKTYNTRQTTTGQDRQHKTGKTDNTDKADKIAKRYQMNNTNKTKTNQSHPETLLGSGGSTCKQPVVRTMRRFAQVVGEINVCHSRGIVHGAISLTSVLLVNGSAKLGGFHASHNVRDWTG